MAMVFVVNHQRLVEDLLGEYTVCCTFKWVFLNRVFLNRIHAVGASEKSERSGLPEMTIHFRLRGIVFSCGKSR
ncbi:uncharacterized protein YALI1_C18730g [Yarrowia lipolytica]|uniref:Uncharacterized protein n=1 Tax=Yarrowia lipolytica TaxID=4952 RepID=A0A1D8NB07_YARLL|nr:hypothetical protein YALI1_C18730g [Yarrowia lipolytica]